MVKVYKHFMKQEILGRIIRIDEAPITDEAIEGARFDAAVRTECPRNAEWGLIAPVPIVTVKRRVVILNDRLPSIPWFSRRQIV